MTPPSGSMSDVEAKQAHLDRQAQEVAAQREALEAERRTAERAALSEAAKAFLNQETRTITDELKERARHVTDDLMQWNEKTTKEIEREAKGKVRQMVTTVGGALLAVLGVLTLIQVTSMNKASGDFFNSVMGLQTQVVAASSSLGEKVSLIAAANKELDEAKTQVASARKELDTLLEKAKAVNSNLETASQKLSATNAEYEKRLKALSATNATR